MTSHDTSTLWTCRQRNLSPAARVCFTFHWRKPDKWEGTNFEVVVEPMRLRTAEVVAIDIFPLIWGQAMTSHRKDQTRTCNNKG